MAAPNDSYPQRGDYIYDQVCKFKVKPVWPLLRVTAPISAPAEVFDMGLIMCSYGHDPDRLAACFAALSWTLKSRPCPNIYFVEAARAGEAFEFEEYFSDKRRVTYIKYNIPEESVGLWLKEALWTLGANYAVHANHKLTKLCFLDADTEFVDQMWAAEVSKLLNTCDVISPHSYAYHEGPVDPKDVGLVQSTAKALLTDSSEKNTPGFSIAFTVKFFKDRLKSTIKTVAHGGGDTFLWYQIAGIKTINYDYGRLPYHFTYPYDQGVVPKPIIGCAEQVVAHRFHGKFSNRLYYQKRLLLKRAVSEPFSEYTFTKKGFPVWSDTPGGRILSTAMSELYERSAETPLTVAETMRLYDEKAVQEYGEINEEYPLVVACILPEDSNESISKVLTLKQQFQDKCDAQHRFVCITNKTIPGVETVPLLTTTIPGHYAVGQVFGALNVNQNTSVLYCDLNTVIYNRILPHRCPLNNISMLRAKEVPTPFGWGSWCSHVMYYRGSLSGLTDTFLSIEHHDYQYVDSALMMVELAVAHDIYPTSIEQHFCTRFYTGNVLPATQLMVFYKKDPVKVSAPWIPNYSLYS